MKVRTNLIAIRNDLPSENISTVVKLSEHEDGERHEDGDEKYKEREEASLRNIRYDEMFSRHFITLLKP